MYDVEDEEVDVNVSQEEDDCNYLLSSQTCVGVAYNSDDDVK